jgi:hypothetical protein
MTVLIVLAFIVAIVFVRFVVPAGWLVIKGAREDDA